MAYRIVMMQLAVAFAVTLSMSFVAVEQAVAAVLGSLVCIVPAAGFAVTATRCRKPGRVVLAGACKTMAVMGLMALAFVLANPAPLGFFVAMAAVHVAYLVVPLRDAGPALGQGAARRDAGAFQRPGSAGGPSSQGYGVISG